jgi:hypothetical protein
MTPCARGCCWTGLRVCAKARACSCHWGDWLTTQPTNNGAVGSRRDPTGNQAIRNVMREQKGMRQ